ncbi:DUF167 domain-containing protein [Candidatus Roizmanbacteria bacterium]|nr:DUF167 domain-containing protein [Candidatus Roizmanbacteria bacterium]
MKLSVKAKAKSKREYVKQLDETHFEIAVHEPPHDGRANAAIKKSLAEFLDIPPSSLVLVSGEKGREKVFELTT